MQNGASNTLPSTDIFRPTVAWDGAGALHAVWSAQVDGNWDLYAPRTAGQKFGPVERLTSIINGSIKRLPLSITT